MAYSKSADMVGSSKPFEDLGFESISRQSFLKDVRAVEKVPVVAIGEVFDPAEDNAVSIRSHVG